MHRPALALVATFAALGGCSGEPASAQAGEAVLPAGPDLRLGVQTHFSQGWPASAIDKAVAVKATILRDSMGWSGVEKVQGQYDFSSDRIALEREACRKGERFILTQVPKNRLYDGGGMVWSEEGMSAYAAFVDAVLKQLPGCVVAIEVGNEINGGSALKYPAGRDGPASYVALLKTLRARIKPANPGVAILGGSTNMIGTGFLDQLFAKGMLPQVDGIAVHPYRSKAQAVDLEIAHLASAMQKHGRIVPVWATEFSHDVADSDVAAGELVKMATLLAGSRIHTAIWYALLDQPAFPHMGLYAKAGLKPVGKAYLNVQERLLPYGRPRKLALGDDLLDVWQFSDGRLVAWGAPRTLALDAQAQLFDAQGNRLPPARQVAVSDAPVLILGAKIASVGTSPVLADTQLGYGTRQWAYFALMPKGQYKPLSLQDDRFTSYIGDRYAKPLRIHPGGAAPGGTAAAPIRAVLRYKAPQAVRAALSACFSKSPKGDGVDYAISKNGQILAKGVFTQVEAIPPMPVDLAAGDQLELSFGPNQSPGGDSFSYRAVLFRQEAARPLACP